MKQIIEKFIAYLRYERNVSPNTIREYRRDTQQFADFITPPGEKTLPLAKIDHRVVREYVSWMYDQHLEKASVGRRLASLRTFFKFCMREKLLRENPARFVPRPKLPKRVPRVLTAEELNGFLDNLGHGIGARQSRVARGRIGHSPEEAKHTLKRDRAVLELLYGAGLRVSELSGLDVENLD